MGMGMDFIFVHINKTAGSSIEEALGLRFRHRTAGDIISEIGIAAWRKNFTFAVVRNPWDKVLSHYSYRIDTNQTGLGNGKIGFAESDLVRALGLFGLQRQKAAVLAPLDDNF